MIKHKTNRAFVAFFIITSICSNVSFQLYTLATVRLLIFSPDSAVTISAAVPCLSAAAPILSPAKNPHVHDTGGHIPGIFRLQSEIWVIRSPLGFEDGANLDVLVYTVIVHIDARKS
jgi:hypothetical protein